MVPKYGNDKENVLKIGQKMTRNSQNYYENHSVPTNCAKMGKNETKM